jgi:hypothetical protein
MQEKSPSQRLGLFFFGGGPLQKEGIVTLLWAGSSLSNVINIYLHCENRVKTV